MIAIRSKWIQWYPKLIVGGGRLHDVYFVATKISWLTGSNSASRCSNSGCCVKMWAEKNQSENARHCNPRVEGEEVAQRSSKKQQQWRMAARHTRTRRSSGVRERPIFCQKVTGKTRCKYCTLSENKKNQKQNGRPPLSLCPHKTNKAHS